MNVNIDPSWKLALETEFKKDYFIELVEFLKTEKASGQVIFPPGSLIFNAFNLTPLDQVKVVIIGQDPYHGPNQAHGLSFSVQQGIVLPPSLLNIFKEIEQDLGVKMSRVNGDLSRWAKQGVLLLNATLTVRANQPNSHSGIGWQRFTDAVIQQINEKKNNIVFILWGNFAKEKGNHIDERKHLVLRSAHPSPFSADKGFFGSKHFSKTNEYLSVHGIEPIDWLIN
ncbi:MAG: uracil-DNA glycosylase [Flavobacteriia bacterium]|jgi:uracil-DNA glycosylase|nr:uracil-DNA glycosylase [Flavobacteriia bacterium]